MVLDVMMPGMDGFETLEEIRKENSLPILMFTSKNDSISKVRGLRAGADDYLTKPFDMDELIARIVSLCGFLPAFQNHPYRASSHPAPQADTPGLLFLQALFSGITKISFYMFRLYAAFNQSAQFSVIIYNQNFIHGVVPFLVLSGHQAASPQF